MSTREERVYWQCLEERRADPSYLADTSGELFDPPDPDTVTRRGFLGRVGFGLAVAASGCTRAPVERAIPFLSQPEEMTPGVSAFYATTCDACPASCGILAKVRDGRPIKIDFNAESPLGGTCAVGQASVLSIYDEGRLKGPLWQGQETAWDEIDRAIRQRLEAGAKAGGKLALLTGTITSPSTRELIGRFLDRFPESRHVVYDPISLSTLRRASAICFGRDVLPRFRFDRAELIVSLDADFLGSWISPSEFARAYAAGRRIPSRPAAGHGHDHDDGHGRDDEHVGTNGHAAAESEPVAMSRHIQFESCLSLTGTNADTRIPVSPSEISATAFALLDDLLERSGQERLGAGIPASLERRRVEETAEELWRKRGRSLVVCGDNDLAAQAAVAAINSLLGNVGRTLDLENPSNLMQGDEGEMAVLIEEMMRGEVGALLIHGVNPAYDWPRAEDFVEGMGNVALTVSFADRLDETASLAHAVCPDHHFLESWGDAQPSDDFYGLRQPALRPLFATRSFLESLQIWQGQAPDHLGYLQDYWRRLVFSRLPSERWVHAGDEERSFRSFWDRALHDGFFQAPLRPASEQALVSGWRLPVEARIRNAGQERPGAGLELRLYEKSGMRDGRHANNPWLQELPDPVTKVVWDNYAAVAPALAADLDLRQEDVVRLTDGQRALELPVYIQPGQAPSCVSVALGYGRRRAGKAGNGVGANAFPLADFRKGTESSEEGTEVSGKGTVLFRSAGWRLEKTGRRYPLAATQTHHRLDGRPIVREATLSEFEDDPGAGAHGVTHELHNLWAEHEKGRHSWGMAIDLTACIGCSSCLIACQAENNVPVVGKEEVRLKREMHWIRIDRYFSGPEENPQTVHQPMMCQHCDLAPCETVCPVLATVHSSDGLNQQVYNRCIGTRYCANNCPYKVRRFNWFQYSRNDRFDYYMNDDLGTMVLNPDVVVRSRGVMEKCSMCVQRIQEGKLTAKVQKRPLRDGDIQTACQQACPADAIAFGDLLNRESHVARQNRDARFFHVLEEIGTRPGVGYLTKIRNKGKA